MGENTHNLALFPWAVSESEGVWVKTLEYKLWIEVECRTCSRESPDSNPALVPFRSLVIFVLSTLPQSLFK